MENGTQEVKEAKVYKIDNEESNRKHYRMYCLDPHNPVWPGGTISDLARSIERQGLVRIINQVPTEIDLEIRRTDTGQPFQVFHYSPLSEKEMGQLHKELAKYIMAKQDKK